MGTRDITRMSVLVAFMAICSWLEIPAVVPFSLQTFGVFFTVEMLDGKLGALAVTVYILLGAAGLPVFSGFSGGIGVLLGPTGGYIAGFWAAAMIMWLIERFMNGGTLRTAARMLLGQIACYAVGTAWFMRAYSAANGPVTPGAAVSWCVAPFIIPDIIKIALAAIVAGRIKRRVNY